MQVARRWIAQGWRLVGGVRGVMVGALPIVIEVISPNRVAISIAIAAVYVAGALVLARPRAIDVPMLIYVFVAAAFIGFSLVRMETIDHLNAAQRDYGLGKATYFLVAALPLSAAAAMLVSTLKDLKPAVVMFMFIGVVIALVTVVLRDSALFGVSRYTTQGNLIAIGGLVACQFWVIKDLRIVAGIALLCLVGVAITESRQSLAAYVIGLGVTGVYWFVADRIHARTGKSTALIKMWAVPAVVYGLILGAVVIWALLIIQPGWIPVPREIKDPVSCNCIAGRMVNVFVDPGGRNVLIEQGWKLFVSHPLFGGGLGSYVGLAPYPYPHNLPLEVAGEMGLVGVIILFAPLVVSWARLTIAGIKAASPAVASAIIIVVVYAVVANLAGDLGSQRGLWVFGLIAFRLGWRRDPAEVVEAVKA